jgi:hypothetical protein
MSEVTPKPSSAVFERNRTEVLRGWAGVGVEIDLRIRSSGYYDLTYRGTTDAMLTAGCLTSSMMAAREAFRQGDPRGLRDENGNRFNLHRSRTVGESERMKLRRWVEPALAMQLPGVCDLFPEAEPPSSEPVDADTGPATPREWKGKQLDYLGHDLRVQASISGNEWRGLGRACGPRFRLAEGDIQRLESIAHRFREEIFAALEQAAVIDTQQSPRPSFLRLVVDND